jgi:DNA-binding CsgD family transcriptional regulator
MLPHRGWTKVAGTAVIGRGSELGHIDRFLDEPARPSALLLEGEAGIGKTTLWEWGVDGAPSRGRRVLQTRAGASETTLSYTALGDLLEPVIDEVVGGLPQPQRIALDAALLRARPEGSTPDQRAVSLASLGSLRVIAQSGPVLLAIDDVQWLDVSSANVLRFVVRRLRDEPIAILASLRLGEADGDPLELDRAIPGGRAQRLLVGSMSLEDLGRLVRDRLGAELPRPVTERVHQVAGGNPFFALEIARELVRRGVPEAGDTLPIPDDLRDLLRARVEALPKPTRVVLLASAATARPTDRLVRAVSGLGTRTDAALARAMSAGVVSVEADRIRFTHPLLASAVYASASPDERRDIHRRLASQVDDREEVARHLALAAPAPDADVASALDDAALIAGARGAPQSAVELSELARRLTPVTDVDDVRRRTVQSAAYHFDAGDDARARVLLEEAIAATGPGPDRARLLYRLASVSWMDMGRVSELSEQALDQSGGDPGLRAAVHEHLAWVGIYRGDLAGAWRHAEASMDGAGRVPDLAIRADVSSTFGMLEALIGRPPHASMAEAERLHDLATSRGSDTSWTVFTAAPACHGLQLLWAGELSAAREILQKELQAFEDRGRYIVRDEVLGYLAELECRAGNWDLAEAYAWEAHEIDVESGRHSGRGHMLFPKALVAAHRGSVDRARSDAEEGLRMCLQNDDLLDASCHRWVLGFLELSLSVPSAAMGHLEPALSYLDALGAAEPGIIPCIPDAVESLVALGRPDDADPLVDRLDEQGRALDRPWARATALRCRGLLLAHRGAPIDALVMLDRALEEHESVPQPFDRARTLLVKGEVERRAKKKKAARSSIEHALGVFDDLGARLWSARARAGLERIGGGVGEPRDLSPTERRVAGLVSEGRTNREVAEALFLSVKTVEANLSRIYHKLGVRSRTEMTRRLALSEPAAGEDE